MAFIIDIAAFMGKALGKAWPYILISIPLSVAVNVTGTGAKIRALIGRGPVLAVILATLLGALSPLCSCTVIPVIFSLLTSGVPLGPVMAFWIASPSMDPEIFFLSVSTLGWNLAIWRLAATFVLSLGSGFLAHALDSAGWFAQGILRERPQLHVVGIREVFSRIQGSFRRRRSQREVLHCDCRAAGEVSSMPVRRAESCSSATGTDGSASAGGISASNTVLFEGTIEPKGDIAVAEPLGKRVLRQSFSSLLFVGKFMVLAYFIEALIVLYVPSEFVAASLGGNSSLSIALATLFGLPFYTTNLAALGLLGGLLDKGMLPAAALAFLISGPTTTLAAMSAVFGIAKKRVFLLYLGMAFLGALVFAGLYALVGGGA